MVSNELSSSNWYVLNMGIYCFEYNVILVFFLQFLLSHICSLRTENPYSNLNIWNVINFKLVHKMYFFFIKKKIYLGEGGIFMQILPHKNLINMIRFLQFFGKVFFYINQSHSNFGCILKIAYLSIVIIKIGKIINDRNRDHAPLNRIFCWLQI